MQSLRTSDLYLADDAFLAQSQERTDAIPALRVGERPKQELRQSSIRTIKNTYVQRTGRASSISHGSSLKDSSIISHRSLLSLALVAGSQALRGIGGRATLKGIALNELLAYQPELFG